MYVSKLNIFNKKHILNKICYKHHYMRLNQKISFIQVIMSAFFQTLNKSKFTKSLLDFHKKKLKLTSVNLKMFQSRMKKNKTKS